MFPCFHHCLRLHIWIRRKKMTRIIWGREVFDPQTRYGSNQWHTIPKTKNPSPESKFGSSNFGTPFRFNEHLASNFPVLLRLFYTFLPSPMVSPWELHICGNPRFRAITRFMARGYATGYGTVNRSIIGPSSVMGRGGAWSTSRFPAKRLGRWARRHQPMIHLGLNMIFTCVDVKPSHIFHQLPGLGFLCSNVELRKINKMHRYTNK